MDIRQSPLILGFSLGRWFDVDVRVSVWFLLLVLILCLRLDLQLGIIVSVLLFGSILFHEFAHVFGARQTGGEGDEILMWPLGGLASVRPASGFYSEFWTIAAGPLSNLLLCLICLPSVLTAGVFWDSFHPIVLPPVDLSLSRATTFINSLFVLLFALNLKLFVLNLLPIHPLDGGQIAFTVAKQYWDKTSARLGSLYGGAILCIILGFVAMYAESTEGVFLVFLLMTFVLQAHMAAVFSQRFGEMGIGYGAEETDEYGLFEQKEEQGTRASLIQQWKQRRLQKRRDREAKQQRETSQKVDELLEKINVDGIDSLSEAEKKFLQQASSKYRSRDI